MGVVNSHCVPVSSLKYLQRACRRNHNNESNNVTLIRYEETCLQEAVRGNNSLAALELLENEFDPGLLTRRGFSLLHFAAENGNKEIVEILLKSGVNPDIHCKDSQGGSTPLILACATNGCSVVSTLMEHKADVNAVDTWGNTALTKAVHSGCNYCVRLLLDNNADPNAYNKWGSSPLQQASRINHLGIMKMLLDSGSDPNHLGDENGMPPVFYMGTRNNVDGLKMLMDAGVDVNTKYRNQTLFSFLIDPYNYNYFQLHENSYPCFIDFLISTGINVTDESFDYMKRKMSSKIYINSSYYIELFGLVLKSQSFGKCSNILDVVFTNLLKGDGRSLQNTNLLHLLLSLGLSPTKSHMEYFSETTDAQQLSLLQHFHNNPRELSDICRLTVRGCIKENVPFKCKDLPIPQLVKDYVTISSPFYFSRPS